MNLTLILQGIILGVAAVLPGLSTSVAAVIMGVYEKLIELIDNTRKDFKGSLKTLIPLGIGGVIGILISVKLVLVICEIFPVQSYFFFAGLVLGGMPIVIKKIRKVKFNPKYLIITVIAFAILMLISLTNETQAEGFIDLYKLDSLSAFVKMIFAGVFSVSLMAIPGVSGSIMLMIIGQYGTVYNAASEGINMVSSLIKGDMAGFSTSLSSVLLLLPFIIGAVVGILIIAKILNFLLKKYEAQVYYGVVGILISSVVTLIHSALFVYLPASTSELSPVLIILISLALLIAGVLSTVFLDKPADEKKEAKPAEKI